MPYELISCWSTLIINKILRCHSPETLSLIETIFACVSAFVSNENSPVLPIHGDVDDEITLSLNLPEGSNNLFKLNGKILQLVHPLDRDKENLSHIQFSVSVELHSTLNPRVISEFNN